MRNFCMVAALLVLPAVLLDACGGGMSEEDRVKVVIGDVVKAAGDKDLDGVKRHISKRYRDPAGNDYEALKGIVLFYFMQPEGISLFTRRQRVEVKGDKAIVTLNAVISRGQKVKSIKDLVPAESGGFVFDLTFEREGGKWLLTSATWRQVGMAEAL